MKFFKFSQNNSGGRFHVDDKLAELVLIEADTAEDAISRAESIGLYWDGVENDMDCSCCGDRWYRPWPDDGIQFPYLYNKRMFTTPEDYMEHIGGACYVWTNPYGYIHYKDGRKVVVPANSKVKL
jgi:hypothetical protein